MAITDLDEQLLVRAHQAGDEHAFGQIVRTQHRALYAHAYRRLGNHEAAEDAVQDTLLRAYRALPSFDGDLRLRAWLHRILTNVCHDESNRRRRQLGLIDKLEAQPVVLAPDPVDDAVLHDTVRVMNEALAELPESYREALVLRYVDGLSFREVAEVAGISEENARARVHRGRQALHKVLSRIAIMLAFIIPGLRRTQKALDTGGDAAVAGGGTDHAVSLSTQLASHITQAAPMINRVAAEGSALVTAKSSVVATAVAAVAAVSAPVVAYQVYETQKAPERPPAAVASPLDEEAADKAAAAEAGAEASAGNEIAAAGDEEAGADSTSTTFTLLTTSTLPPSAAEPFAGSAESNDDEEEADTTSTTSPRSEEPDATESSSRTIGELSGDAFEVTGVRPDFDVRGPVTLEVDGDDLRGVLSGAVYVSDTVGGDAKGELDLTLDDGTVHRVRFRGTLAAEDVDDDRTTWLLTGGYSIPNGDELGLAPSGDAAVVFYFVADAPSTLSFGLQGNNPE